jgi:hypothetical protein
MKKLSNCKLRVVSIKNEKNMQAPTKKNKNLCYQNTMIFYALTYSLCS